MRILYFLGDNLVRGRSKVYRGLAKCQAVPSEGSAVLCTTEDPTGSEAEGYYCKNRTNSPSSRRKYLRYSYMPINRQSSLPTLSYRVGLLT